MDVVADFLAHAQAAEPVQQRESLASTPSPGASARHPPGAENGKHSHELWKRDLDPWADMRASFGQGSPMYLNYAEFVNALRPNSCAGSIRRAWPRHNPQVGISRFMPTSAARPTVTVLIADLAASAPVLSPCRGAGLVQGGDQRLACAGAEGRPQNRAEPGRPCPASAPSTI